MLCKSIIKERRLIWVFSTVKHIHNCFRPSSSSLRYSSGAHHNTAEVKGVPACSPKSLYFVFKPDWFAMDELFEAVVAITFDNHFVYTHELLKIWFAMDKLFEAVVATMFDNHFARTPENF
jgi:hypothetical protein